MQLLKTINSEFGIGSDKDNTKELIDGLNGYLMEKKADGKKVEGKNRCRIRWQKPELVMYRRCTG